MGQDQAKSKSDTSTAYEREAARMHHVTTKDTIVATKAPHDEEADRLQERLKSMKHHPPLVVASVEGAIIGKREKLVEEVTQNSPTLKDHALFNEDLVRLFAQYQTIEMREGSAAAKRAEEITSRMGQTVFYSNVLRSSATAATQRLKHTVESLTDVDSISDELQQLHDMVVEISHVAMEINAMIPEAERMEIKAEVDKLMHQELIRSRSGSAASTPVATPR